METATEARVLDLSYPERMAVVAFAGKEAKHFFRPLTLKDWVGYFTQLATEFISRGDEVSPQSQEEQAAAALWDSAILRVEGYQGGEWRDRMPVSHKVAAIRSLQQALAVDAGDPFDLQSDIRIVRLEASWNGEIYENLLHRFRLPSAAHAHAYKRMSVTFLRSRGRRDQSLRIRAAVRLAELCQLYDSLIRETEGYQGENMDPLHKMAAVTALFEPPEPEAKEE